MRILTGLEPKSLYGCPGQPNSEISSLPGQKIPIPRPPGGGLRVRRSSREKNRTLKYHNSSVFDRPEVILGVLSTPDT